MRLLLALLVVLLAVGALLSRHGSSAPEEPLGTPATGPAVDAGAAAPEAPPVDADIAPPRVAVVPEPVAPGDRVAAEATATLVAEVLDTEGAGVFKANVVLLHPRDERTNHLQSADTDPEGFAELVVPSGQPLTIEAGRYGQTTHTKVEVPPLAPGEVRPLAIVVTHRSTTAAAVFVRVEAEDGAPIVGAALHVTRSAGLTTGGPPRVVTPDTAPDVVTDSLGEARVTTEALGITTALVRAPRCAPQLVQLRGSDVTAAPPPVVLVTMLAAARAEGHVEGAPPGARARVLVPGYGLRSTAHRGDAWYGTDYQFEAEVRPDGTFVLEDLPTGAPLRFELAHERRVLVAEPEAIMLGAGEVRRLDWSVAGGVAVRCLVREADGAPAEGIGVWLLSSDEGRPGLAAAYWQPLQRRKTDANGSATFDPVQSGAWIVALAPPARDVAAKKAFAPIAVRALVEADSPAPTVELVLARGRYIRGTIVDPSGGAVRAHVTGYGPSGVFVSESSDAGGVFALGPLVPGTYTLSARIFAAREGEPSFGPSEPVEVEASADTGAEGVELRLTPGASLTVTASRNGAQVPAIFTAVAAPALSAQGYGGKPTLERRFVGLGLGPVVVTATTEDGLFGVLAPYELGAPGEQTVDVPLAPSGRVRIQNAGPHPYLNCAIGIGGHDVFAGTALAGGEEVFHLPSGPARVRLSAFDTNSTEVPLPRLFDETHEFTVVADEEVVIRVPR